MEKTTNLTLSDLDGLMSKTLMVYLLYFFVSAIVISSLGFTKVNPHIQSTIMLFTNFTIKLT